MRTRFFRHFRGLLPILPQRLIVALSGGMDSVALLRLLSGLGGLQLRVVHVNFQLRGEESERGDLFCRELCAELGLELVCERVDTLHFAKTQKLSIQEAARALRYAIFERERLDFQAEYICTAHHAGDSIETFFLNFSKGCGLRGLHGIRPLQSAVLRPLLPFSRTEIAQFMQENGFHWEEDSSNASDKYTRNFLRHRILPIFGELQPNYERIFAANIERIAAAESIYDWALAQLRARYFLDGIIDLQGLREESPVLDLPTILQEWLQIHAFTPAQCREMSAPRAESGKNWQTAKAQIVYKHTPKPHLCLFLKG